MNRTAKVVKQSVISAMLVIVSLYVGIQFGTNLTKRTFLEQTAQKSVSVITFVDDHPKPCPSGC